MASQFTIPVDVKEDAESLKRLLVDLASVLDAIIGTVEDAAITSLASIDNVIARLEERAIENENAFSTVDDKLQRLETFDKTLAFVFNHAAITATPYKDFDDAAWANLKGLAQFTELGSNLANVPFAPVPATSYTFYIDSSITVGGGVVQRLLVEVTGASLVAYYRTGDTFAVALTNGWTAL